MKWISLLLLVLVVGCAKTNFKYVSGKDEYQLYIGQQFKLKSPMYLSGVNLPPGYNDDINIYILEQTSPTWSGPELITREMVQDGVEFTIIQVRKCINCWGDKVQAIIEFKLNRELISVPIVIDLLDINDAELVGK